MKALISIRNFPKTADEFITPAFPGNAEMVIIYKVKYESYYRTTHQGLSTHLILLDSALETDERFYKRSRNIVFKSH